jgi:hypothetical protein
MLSSRVDSDQDRRRAAVDTWEGDVTARVIARLTALRTAQVNARTASVISGPNGRGSPMRPFDSGGPVGAKGGSHIVQPGLRANPQVRPPVESGR